MNTFIDLSPANFASTSSSEPSSPTSPPRAALAPLQNHNYPSSSKSSKQASTSGSIFYAPYPRHQQQIPRSSFKNVVSVQDDASPLPSTSSTASTSTTTTPIPNDNNNNDDEERAAFLAEFDYVDMRSRLTRVELAKKPYLNEEGVLFHSPALPSVTYDTIFQTTHDFLDLSIMLHMYPTFVDLPFHLRPSKARYDATKQSEDQMLRVRCLFCRGRFGGKNAKAIWERHVKEHWPKQGESTTPIPRHHHRHHEPLSEEAQVSLKWVDRTKEYPKEETRRPIRQIQKRPTGSNAHSRTRSHDSSAWAPVSRYNASTSSPSPPSSRASSEEFHEIPRVTTPAVSFPAAPTEIQYISSQSSSSSSDEASDAHESDAEPTIRIPFIRTPHRSPRKRANRNPFQRSPGFTDDLDTFTFQSCWDIDANLEMIEQTSKPCLSKDQLQAALDAATTRSDEEESPRKTARVYRGSLIPNVAVAAIPGFDIPTPSTRKRVREEDVEFIQDVAWMVDYYSFAHQDRKRRHTESGSSVGALSDSSSSGGDDGDSSLEYGFEVASPQEDEALMDTVDWVATD